MKIDTAILKDRILEKLAKSWHTDCSDVDYEEYLGIDFIQALDEVIAESRKIPKAKQRKRVPNKSNQIPKG